MSKRDLRLQNCFHENETTNFNLLRLSPRATVNLSNCSGLRIVCRIATVATIHHHGSAFVRRHQQSRSRANSINDRIWLAGYSNLAGNQSRHAALWRQGALTDLGTLGGPNSAVTFSVKSDLGIVAGISQTGTPDPLGEAWSSAAFYPGATGTGFINLGFVWQNGTMHALPTLGGNNGFATGANSLGQIVGWAENSVHDPTCVPPQQLQFRPVVYGSDANQISELPLPAGDSSGAATGINEQDQVVG